MRNLIKQIVTCGIIFFLWILVCIYLSKPASAQEVDNNDWSNGEIAKQVSASSLLVLDWGQTLDIRNHAEIHETNLILGKHPENKRIDAYFGAVLISEVVAADLLPRKYRNWLLDGTIAVELVAVGHNKSIGLNVKF